MINAEYHWELHLDEPKKGLIPISEAGSGLRTVLLVLANLIILPLISKEVALPNCFFAFEELENNLHPAIQRRLFRILQSFADEHKCRFFITTHSNVVIDLFSGADDAQILHVVHDGDESVVSTVTTSQHAWHVLDDLDVRGSDLLQTNVVVWVEGPSDRIYFNKWMEIWTDGKLVEGMHYQCVTYGGKLSHHISYQDPEQLVADMIAALKINRNAVFIGDSDKKKESDTIQDNTQRIVNEVTEDGKGLAWITAGKEVENYIPAAVFKIILKDGNVQGPSQFTDVPNDYVGKKSKKRTKVELAREVVPHLSKTEMPLDWSERMGEVAKFICQCNRLGPDTYEALP